MTRKYVFYLNNDLVGILEDANEVMEKISEIKKNFKVVKTVIGIRTTTYYIEVK